MNTHAVVGFRAGGTQRLSYVFSDGHPTRAGLRVLRFVRQLVKDAAVTSAEQRVSNLEIVADGQEAVPEGRVAELARWTDMSLGWPSQSGRPTWYQALRRTQGDPDAMLTAGVIVSEDWLEITSHQWGYMIDFASRLHVVWAYGRKAYSAPFDQLPTDEAFLTHLDHLL